MNGLEFGISAYLIRLLCESPFTGGLGLSPIEVSKLTPDQIYFLACDKKMLGNRVSKMTTEQSMSVVRVRDGKAQGTTSDGRTLNLPFNVGGKSQVQLIRERQEAAAKKKKRR